MKKLFNIAIQMDPWSTINPKGDSTYSIALEAQKRGHKLFCYSCLLYTSPSPRDRG